MKTCPSCRTAYPAADVTFCPRDGSALTSTDGLQQGTIIRKKYQILNEIGRGGMGVVYRVRHMLWNEEKAIKLLLDVSAAGGKPSQSLLSEALLLRQLEHPNIVRVEDADFTEDDQLFVVMEYVEGESLQHRMKHGPLAWKLALNFTAQACAGLSAAHRKGIIHRDIKPQNLLLTAGADGREVLKLIDFGIAKVREDAGLGFAGMETCTAGSFTGTPEYASPEQAMGMRGADIDARTDLYSLGLVLFEMLTGARPFAADTAMASLLLRLQTQPVAPRKLRPDLDIPQAVSDLVTKAIARDKESRYGSAEKMQAAIEDILNQLPASTIKAPPVSESSSKKRAPTVIIGLAAGIAAVALATWLFWPRSAPAPEPIKVAQIIPQAMVVAGPAQATQKPSSSPKTTATKPPAPRPATPPSKNTSMVKVNPADGLKYIWLKPGKFMMGCSPTDTDCNADENPAHEVTISKGFWMAETEVTQAAYERVIGSNPSNFKGPDLPVESVSWFQAKSYCKAAGMRLPTEAEWEYAARAGNGRQRYGRPGEIAWWGPNSEKKTHDVGQKQPNGYGLYDLLGNVAEWTADWYGPYADAAETDPHGAQEGQYRTLRGGSWLVGLAHLRASDRVNRKPAVRGAHMGFRCAGD